MENYFEGGGLIFTGINTMGGTSTNVGRYKPKTYKRRIVQASDQYKRRTGTNVRQHQCRTSANVRLAQTLD